MADQQKPVEEVLPVAPVVDTAAETKPVETPADEAKPAETEAAPAAEAAAEPVAAPAAEEDKPAAEDDKEEKKEEEAPTPVEEGTLEHKGAGANFPKNLYYSKQPFWFGSDAVEKAKLATYLKHEKNVNVAYHNASWAQSTGKGLLFFGDKASPTGIINLAEAGEPQADGANKFSFAANGHKHSFKAATKAEADNWVSQLKAKIAEAKEVATTIKDTEEYKSAYEVYKPTPAKKEEKKEEEADKPAEAAEAAAKDEEAKPEEEAAKDEPAQEEAKPEEEVAKEEEKKEEPVKEETKRRSASRKRTSVLGFFGKKDKKEEEKAADKPTEAAAESPAEEAAPAPEAEASPAVEEAPAAPETPAEEPKPAEEAKEVKESPKEKPALPSKRNRYVLATPNPHWAHY